MRDKQFILDVIPSDLLDSVVDWIGEHLSPDEVFDEDTLFDWCGLNANDADKVCPDDLLHEWAVNNGYVEEE